MNPPDDDRMIMKHWQDSNPPLPDDGFSDRVLAALPSPAPSRRSASVWLPALAGGIAGLGAFLAHLPSAADWHVSGVRLATHAQAVATAAGAPWVAPALCIAIGSLLMGYLAYRWATRRAW